VISAQRVYDAFERYLWNAQIFPTVPPRKRLADRRADARRANKAAGRCLWHRHPEPLPPVLSLLLPGYGLGRGLS
jgi:hypothetical protein